MKWNWFMNDLDKTYMKRIIQQVITLVTLCWMMAGCSHEDFNQEYGEGVGYLRLALGSVDVELLSTSRAETGSLPEELIPVASDFMVDIQKEGSSIEGFPKKYSEITDGIELMSGLYTVKAEYGDNGILQTTPYFAGSATVQIFPGKQVEAEIGVALANAMLSPAVSESLQNHYTTWKLTVEAGDASMTLAEQGNTGGCLFVQAGQSVKALFEGTNQVGKETSHEWSVISSSVARTKYVLQCDPDVPVFSFGLNAVAEHTKDDSGYLDGTRVSLSFGDLSNVPVSLISNWKATLVNPAGEVVRSYSSNNFANSGAMEMVDNWTYLPQGVYTLKYSYIIDGAEVSEEETEAQTIEIPKPEFQLNVVAQTSYSIYTSQGAAAANEQDGSSIFGISAELEISSAILENEKYANLLPSVTYSLDSGESSSDESPVFQNLQWGKHRLTATALFDGGTASSSVDCEVTGIPYRGDYSSVSPFDDTKNSWISVGTGEYWSGRGYILFEYYFDINNNCFVFSPAFQLPTMVDVSYSTKVAYFTTGLGNPSINIYTGVSDRIDNSVKDKTTSIKKINSNSNPKDNQFTVISDNATIGNNYRICISHDGEEDSNWAQNWLTFKSLEVLYR